MSSKHRGKNYYFPQIEETKNSLVTQILEEESLTLRTLFMGKIFKEIAKKLHLRH